MYGYIPIGTLWAWFALKVYYKEEFNQQHTLWQIPTIALNCFLFPIGLLGLLFFYITKDRYQISEDVNGIVFNEEIGFLVSHMGFWNNETENKKKIVKDLIEEYKNKEKENAKNKKD